MTKKVVLALPLIAAIVAILAEVGPAAGTVRDGLSFLWPTGIVCILGLGCVLEGWLLWRCRPRADVLADRKEQEAAHRAALVAVEPYINAHRTEAAVLEEEANIYVPELREAEAETANANQQFVSARQQVEQHGSQAVLDVVRAIEAAVNSGDLDGAVRLRHDRLVPAIRAASV